MLIITRKADESIIINDNIEITVVEVTKDKVKLGFNAPQEVKIKRKELYVTEKENINASKNIDRQTIDMIIKNKERCGNNGNIVN